MDPDWIVSPIASKIQSAASLVSAEYVLNILQLPVITVVAFSNLSRKDILILWGYQKQANPFPWGSVAFHPSTSFRLELLATPMGVQCMGVQCPSSRLHLSIRFVRVRTCADERDDESFDDVLGRGVPTVRAPNPFCPTWHTVQSPLCMLFSMQKNMAPSSYNCATLLLKELQTQPVTEVSVRQWGPMSRSTLGRTQCWPHSCEGVGVASSTLVV